MHCDIVIPDNNEAEFIDIALRLGIKKLYFLYEFGKSQKEILEKTEPLNREKTNIAIGLIVSDKNIGKALQHSKLLVAKSSDKDRFFIESKKIKLIYGFEESQRKDYLHQRASGLNHILCELARKNNVAVGFSYSSLFDNNPETVSLKMGRMMQNISLCQKYKVKTIIGSFAEKSFDLRAPYDVMSLFTMLGMDGKKVKESLMQDI